MLLGASTTKPVKTCYIRSTTTYQIYISSSKQVNSPKLDEVCPHLHHSLFRVYLRRRRIEINVEYAKVEEITELISMTDAGSINIQQALVKSQSTVIGESVHVCAVRGVLGVHLSRICHSANKHLIGQQEDHVLDGVLRDLSTT